MWMRKLFLLLFVADVTLTLLSFFALPNQVAIHFGQGGFPTSWASRQMHLSLGLLTDALILGTFYFSPALILKSPPRLVNLPHKEFWLKEENKPLAHKKLAALMAEFGTVILLFFIFIAILVIRANWTHPVRLNESLFMPAFLFVMGYTLFWVMKIYRAFRLPDTA